MFQESSNEMAHSMFKNIALSPPQVIVFLFVCFPLEVILGFPTEFVDHHISAFKNYTQAFISLFISFSNPATKT